MMCVRYSLVAGLILLSAAGCKRGSDQSAGGAATSAFLDDASPEAREALAIQVDYRLTDESFARWERAQRSLDRLPSSAIPAQSSGGGGNVIDRAVTRLESSPRARTAIEATGLTVRDFVLQTIALAQATEAASGGRPAGAGVVPPENFRFVERHRDRVRRAQAAARIARRNAESYEDQFGAGQQMGGDTAMQVETGMEASQEGANQAQSERAEEGQRNQSDPGESGEQRDGENTSRDTTRDSVAVNR